MTTARRLDLALHGGLATDGGGYSPAVARRFYAFLDRLGRLLHVEVRGLENVPSGRALFVANHAFGWDVALPIAAIARATGRPVFTLGEHAWWKFPLLRSYAALVGTVDGTPENADRLLARDEKVVVLPGGLREAMKPRELRYRLLWGNRYGFVRAAVRHKAPLVPLACVGSDDVFDLVGNAYERGRRFFGRWAFPLPRPAYGVPIPHRARLLYVIGEPILIPDDARADDAALVRRLRREVEGALHEIIEETLAARAGFTV